MKFQITAVVAVSPSNSVLAKAIIPIIKTDGDLVYTPLDSADSASFTKPVTAGEIVPIICKRVLAASTCTLDGGIAD